MGRSRRTDSQPLLLVSSRVVPVVVSGHDGWESVRQMSDWADLEDNQWIAKRAYPDSNTDVPSGTSAV